MNDKQEEILSHFLNDTLYFPVRLGNEQWKALSLKAGKSLADLKKDIDGILEEYPEARL